MYVLYSQYVIHYNILQYTCVLDCDPSQLRYSTLIHVPSLSLINSLPLSQVTYSYILFLQPQRAHAHTHTHTHLQSAIPHLIMIGLGNRVSSVATIIQQLSVFRILRSLRMVCSTHGQTDRQTDRQTDKHSSCHHACITMLLWVSCVFVDFKI